MTLVQMEKRVKALEQTLQDLAATKRAVNRKWYRTHRTVRWRRDF
jgi:hypothetical protein